MVGLLHDSARDLWSRMLSDGDRVLVTGASGWIGRTACALLETTGCTVLPLASNHKDVTIGRTIVHCKKWDWDEVRAFRPTVVIDCAFLTRDHLATLPLASYVETNDALTANMLAAAQLDSVSRIISISSGAAVYPHDSLHRPMENNPYGWLKRRAEVVLGEATAQNGASAVVARAWSLSGAFVQHPANYALADMILQARLGAIYIRATRPVYRRYVSVEDLLAVSLANATTPGTQVIDSGGPLLEMGELAQTIARVVNPSAIITRAEGTGEDPDAYYAPIASWEAACHASGFTAAGIDAQITVTHAGLSRR